jgi:hypothetical protein
LSLGYDIVKAQPGEIRVEMKKGVGAISTILIAGSF